MIRFRGERERTYEGVKALLEAHKRKGDVYPVIICQYSLMEENEHEADDFKKYWNELGAEVKFRPKLEWTATGSITSDRIDHDPNFRIACPWGNNTMAIHQDGSVVACAVDSFGSHIVANVNEVTVKEAWRLLGETLRKHHKNHDWEKIPDVCKRCNDWQTAGAEHEEKEEVVEGTRPFWYDQKVTNFKVPNKTSAFNSADPHNEQVIKLVRN